ncbi:uncharacterized protein TNCV_3552831 [Trichonephila clavipes]|nr:uncharacterized protein TNCV_3552831 [Trichonephila clavipes]
MEEMSQRVKDLEKKLLACGKTKNGNKFVPASPVPIPASPIGEAAEVLQTLTDTELPNLNSLYNALDLRFGQKFSKDYARLQMKIKHQKSGERMKKSRIQMAVRMANVKDLKSALLYALKVEAATQASCIDRYSIRE